MRLLCFTSRENPGNCGYFSNGVAAFILIRPPFFINCSPDSIITSMKYLVSLSLALFFSIAVCTPVQCVSPNKTTVDIGEQKELVCQLQYNKETVVDEDWNTSERTIKTEIRFYSDFSVEIVSGGKLIRSINKWEGYINVPSDNKVFLYANNDSIELRITPTRFNLNYGQIRLQYETSATASLANNKQAIHSLVTVFKLKEMADPEEDWDW